jgi:phosphoribosylformylglycinamidine cyclo-ligase
VQGLAHITGDGLLNLLRLATKVGYEIDAPLPVPPIFKLIEACGKVPPTELYEVFNMGCGFCVIVGHADASAAVALLSRHYPGSAVIGKVTRQAGQLQLPTLGLTGDRNGFNG